MGIIRIKKQNNALEKEKDESDSGQARRTPPGEEQDLGVVTLTTSEELPFSKARCVVLVATVGAAPFLSVRCLNSPPDLKLRALPNVDLFRSVYCYYSSYNWRSA